MTGAFKKAVAAGAAMATVLASSAQGVEPVLARNPAALPLELPRGAEIPQDLDPLADGVLMKHQREWLDDHSDLKIAKKGRRTGVTFADTLRQLEAQATGADKVDAAGTRIASSLDDGAKAVKSFADVVNSANAAIRGGNGSSSAAASLASVAGGAAGSVSDLFGKLTSGVAEKIAQNAGASQWCRCGSRGRAADRLPWRQWPAGD